MGAAAARRFYQGIQEGDIAMTLGGFAMGNSWIHPVDSTVNWGPLLYYWVCYTFVSFSFFTRIYESVMFNSYAYGHRVRIFLNGLKSTFVFER